MIKKKNLSEDDKKVWEDYTRNPSDIIDKEIDYSRTVNEGRYKFDLHGYTLNEANKKVKEIILFCVEKNYKEILLITGKGIHSKNDKNIFASKNLGKLKYSVPDFIQSDEDLRRSILSISEASLKDGGAGALLLKLKKL